MQLDDRSGYYQRSKLEWAELRALAVEVAATTRRLRTSRPIEVETVSTEKSALFGRLRKVRKRTTHEVPDDHWVLEQRFWRKEERTSSGLVISVDTVSFCLSVTGDLYRRVQSSESTFIRGKLVSKTINVDDSPLADHDVLLLDYAPRRYEHDDGTISVVTDRDASEQLVAYYKGYGLRRLLNSLLSQ